MMKTETHLLAPDGGIPNSRLPLVIFRAALPAGLDGEDACALLAHNGWGGNWIDGVFPYWHFHTRGHEVLACTGGEARIGLGGDDQGLVATFVRGDVCIIPAGVGHKRIGAGPGFQVVGGYPPGQTGNIVRPGAMSDRQIAGEIAKVALPASDPVTGGKDGVVAIWAAS